MSVSVVKVAPTAVILAVSGACAWPYLDLSTPPPLVPSKSAAVKEIPATLLKPTPSSKPVRDPFLDPEVLQTEAREKIRQTLRSLTTLRKAVKTPATSTASKPPANPPARKVAEVDPRTGLVLNATSVHAQGGVAMINGRPYATGDWLRPPEVVAPCLLAEVRAREVVLLYKGRRLSLGYPAHGTVRTPSQGTSGTGEKPVGATTAVTAGEATAPESAAAGAAPVRGPARRPTTRKRVATRN